MTNSPFRAALQWFYRSIGIVEFGGPSDDLDESSPDRSLEDRVTEVYWLRVRGTGLGRSQARAARGELARHVSECVAHFRSEAPDEIERIETKLARYDRLRRAAGIDRRFLEQPSKLLPGALGHVQGVVEVVLGALPALIGLVTGGLPYFGSRAYARRVVLIKGAPGATVTTRQLLLGLLPFFVFYDGLVVLTAWQFSDQATLLLAILLVPTGLFALAYARRVRTIVAHIGDRTAAWLKLDAVTRVREARDDLVAELDAARNRYREDALGWDALPSDATRPRTRVALLRVARIGGLLATLALGLSVYADQPIEGMPLGPSPWQAVLLSDPAIANQELEKDASGVLLIGDQLERLQAEMMALQADFDRGDRSLLTQEDHDRIKAVLVAYLDHRTALLHVLWRYRPEDPEAIVTTDATQARAFLTAYTAAALLTEKAWVLYESFSDDPGTRAELDRGDRAWSLPSGTFTFVEGSLTNASAMSELRTAMSGFDAVRNLGAFGSDEPWSRLVERAELARPALEAATHGVWRRKMARALPEMMRQIRSPAREITPVVSMTVSRFRLKERPPHRGLITPEQVEQLRGELRPGDILIERRNWYISNSLLPGFWPHAALYLGSHAELAALGLDDDPRASIHMDAFQGQNARGDHFAVLEAIGEGVIFTSLEQSVGEADAVVVLRPLLSDDDLREGLARALSHRGKEYDFDFDFITTDRLVCTELIFRAYDGLLDIPEMRLIMGQPRIAASDYVRMWADGRASGAPQLELVRFLDFDERNGVAVESDAETLVETLERSRFTFLN